ncbi:MAG: hypothetical protein Q8O67_10715 [Deltaproteobacteria bacterium]|nr:hypothetical protein [Deltaproteobacteria bacterium]
MNKPLLALAFAAFAVPAAAQEARSIDVLAFSDDGTFALAKETSYVGPMTTTTLLLVGPGGVNERLPVSVRVAGLAKDGVDREVCLKSADRLSSMAKDLRGVTVRTGACNSESRAIVDARGKPRSQSSSSKNLPLIAAAGFPGDVFVAPQGPLVIVIGRDALGSDRLGTTLID